MKVEGGKEGRKEEDRREGFQAATGRERREGRPERAGEEDGDEMGGRRRGPKCSEVVMVGEEMKEPGELQSKEASVTRRSIWIGRRHGEILIRRGKKNASVFQWVQVRKVRTPRAIFLTLRAFSRS